MKPKLYLVIPCYNEEEVLRDSAEKLLRKYESMMSQHKITFDSKIVFIDDGSKDKTLSILKEYAEKDTRVKYLSFSRNFGKEAAMYAGLEKCSGDYAVIMDADLQDPPALLSEMLDSLRHEDYDSVATRRVTRKGEPKIRSWFARQFYKLINKSRIFSKYPEIMVNSLLHNYQGCSKWLLKEEIYITQI